MPDFAQQQATDSAFAPMDHSSPLGVLDLIPGIGPMVQLAQGLGGAVGSLFDGLFDHTDSKPNGKAAAMDAGDAGKLLDKQYLEGNDIMVDPNQQMGNLDGDSKQQRLAALSKLNQVNPDDPDSDHYCGPSAILAAAVYAKGGKGVDAILDQLEATRKEGEDPDEMLEAIRKHADKGKLDVSDMQQVQAKLYEQMREQMKNDPSISDADKAAPGINGKTMQDYIKKNPAMASMFKDNDMAVSFIDSSGDGKKDHYVLDINDPSRAAGGNADGGYNTVYDPFARKGGQVQTDAAQVNAYNSTAHTNFGA